jgi:O-acetylhomoserine (thiol)-lyase
MKFNTIQIHGGYKKSETNARGAAIYPTAAYHFNSCESAANLFQLKENGNIYSRLQNPTSTAYEERVAALEGGVGAVAVSSGMSAILIALTSLAQGGDNIVSSPFLYGGTSNLFNITLKKLGIDFRIPDNDTVEEFEKFIDNKTKGIFVESMGNPTCNVPDLEGLGNLAKKYDVPLIVDNTFGACGYLCRPFEYGANIIVESATKWINGHGTAMGGIIIDGGNYNWDNGKFPAISGPSEGYHGLNLYKTFGNMAYIVKCRVDGLRDFGCCPSPFDSYLMEIGLETLSLRVKYEVESAYKLAEYFKTNPKVKKVNFVGYNTHRSYLNARKFFRFGSSSVLSIELEGSLETTKKFVESLNLVAHMVMIGDSVTVITHPASTTHEQLNDEDKIKAGVTPTLLRISTGLEDINDIISDFNQAFEKIF